MDSSRVGQPYVSDRTEWPEGAGYSHAADGHVLTIFMRSLDRRKVEAVRRSKCQFALVMGYRIFFLMYRFGKAIAWSSAPYWGVTTPNEERPVPTEGWPESGIVVHVVLVDAATGMVRAVRPVTLPPGFACDLHKAIRHQAAFPFLSKSGYDTALANMRRLCPTNRRLLQRAVACTGPVPREKLAHRIWIREQGLNLLFDLLNWYSIHGDDKEVNIYASSVMRTIDA